MVDKLKQSKAQASFVSYVLTILLSVLVLGSITLLFYTFYNTSLQNEIRESLRQLAIQMSDNIIKIYENFKDVRTEPGNYTNTLLYEGDLNLPTSVSNRDYEILLVTSNPSWSNIANITIENQTVYPILFTSGAKVIARTTQSPIVSVEYDIPNINAIVEGRSQNGIDTKLRYYRNNINGTMYDIITIGNQDVLLKITTAG